MNAMRYVFLLAAVLIVGLVLGIAMRPKMDDLRRATDDAFYDYAKTNPTVLTRSYRTTSKNDWFVVASYTMTIGESLSFTCWGGWRLKVCTTPDDLKPAGQQ